jgi:hypothetical protein
MPTPPVLYVEVAQAVGDFALWRYILEPFIYVDTSVPSFEVRKVNDVYYQLRQKTDTLRSAFNRNYLITCYVGI